MYSREIIASEGIKITYGTQNISRVVVSKGDTLITSPYQYRHYCELISLSPTTGFDIEFAYVTENNTTIQNDKLLKPLIIETLNNETKTLKFFNLPTLEPTEAGTVWRDGNILKIKT